MLYNERCVDFYETSCNSITYKQKTNKNVMSSDEKRMEKV